LDGESAYREASTGIQIRDASACALNRRKTVTGFYGTNERYSIINSSKRRTYCL